MIDTLLRDISPNQPVLIAGPTASGKSALALAIAEAQGGVIVNADASQVFACWQVITARPDAEETARAEHVLYGHVAHDATYSTGHWLEDARAVLARSTRPIFVGGTGLYFAALTEGLAEIPKTPPGIRATADTKSRTEMLTDLDDATCASIDTANRARVQRAWEVLKTTARGLAAWQDDTPAPVLPGETCARFVIDAPKDWLTPRIETRFDKMLKAGALEEVREMLPAYDASLPAFRAIGVPQLAEYLFGDTTLDDATDRANIATRQYAKRQRTWFRKRCTDWTWVQAQSL